MSKIDHLIEAAAEEIVGGQCGKPRSGRYGKLSGSAHDYSSFWEFMPPAIGREPSTGAALQRFAGPTSYSSPGVGSQAHLAAEIFAERIGVKLMHVPYNSVSTALSDVAGGQVDLMFAQLPTALPFIKDGRVRAFGIASENRSILMPEMPTLAEETGVSIGEAVSWSGLLAPAGTPLTLREAIAKRVTAAMQSPDVQERLKTLGTV